MDRRGGVVVGSGRAANPETPVFTELSYRYPIPEALELYREFIVALQPRRLSPAAPGIIWLAEANERIAALSEQSRSDNG